MSPTLLVPRDNAVEAWTPARWSSSQLGFWFKGSLTQGTPPAIATVVDSSGNARTLNSVSANPPDVATLTVNGASRNCIECKVATSECVWGEHSAYAQETAGTLWCVFETNSTWAYGTHHGLISIGTSDSGTRRATLCLFKTGSTNQPAFYHNTGVAGNFAHCASANVSDASTRYSVVWEADAAANTSRCLLNEASAGTITYNAGAAAGDWISDWATYQPNRIGLGCEVQNGTPSIWFLDAKIIDAGWRRAKLGADETDFLAYLTSLRA